jgi:transposase
MVGNKVYDLKTFYRGAKVTVIRAISLNKIVELMTVNESINSQLFAVFVEHCGGAKLMERCSRWDNLPAHKLAVIEPLIQAAGASILNLSPYSPDFNPIELWWSQLKAFLRNFSPTTTKMVDLLLATALDLVNIKHFKN